MNGTRQTVPISVALVVRTPVALNPSDQLPIEAHGKEEVDLRLEPTRQC